ncbi:MAG: flagellar motor switch protein FliG [Planctomycetota bacterium]
MADVLTGQQKAAVLLVSLKQELAAKVLSQMDTDTIEMIGVEIARLDQVSAERRDVVLDEFIQLASAMQYVEQGGLTYARGLLERSLSHDKAEHILGILEQSVKMTPFNFLQKAESENLLTFIQDEHPQTIALILAYLRSNQSAAILEGLPAKKQIEVVKRIAKMQHTSPDVIREVERSLEKRVMAIVSQELEETGGVETVAEMLNRVDRATEKSILESLEEDDPDLVEHIRRLMFVFEDILLVNDKGIQAVLREVDHEDLALALKTASEEVKDKIFRNMSERAAALIKEDMEYMGPVRIADVEAAQQRIVDVVRRLEETGTVIIQGRGGEGEIVV